MSNPEKNIYREWCIDELHVQRECMWVFWVEELNGSGTLL